MSSLLAISCESRGRDYNLLYLRRIYLITAIYTLIQTVENQLSEKFLRLEKNFRLFAPHNPTTNDFAKNFSSRYLCL